LALLNRAFKDPKRLVFWKEKGRRIKAQVEKLLGEKILKTPFAKGKVHAYNIYKNRKVKVKAEKNWGDKACIKKRNNITTPRKKPHKSAKNSNPKLTKEEKKSNRKHSKVRIEIEHSLAYLKKFKILSERNRNRRRRFKLRFNLICALFNQGFGCV